MCGSPNEPPSRHHRTGLDAEDDHTRARGEPAEEHYADLNEPGHSRSLSLGLGVVASFLQPLVKRGFVVVALQLASEVGELLGLSLWFVGHGSRYHG